MDEPAVQSNAENDTPTEGGVTGAGFTTGRSGNPGGRPKGIARLARELVGSDGEAILRFYFAAMAGKMTNPDYDPAQPKSEANPEHVTVSERGRLEAAKLLTERGFGKAPQYAPMDEPDPLGLQDREADESAAALDRRFDEVAAARQRREATAATG